MLRRQQANAVIAARTRIVEGAVGMVEMALEQLSAKKVVELDEERKAAMVEQPARRPVLGARGAAGRSTPGPCTPSEPECRRTRPMPERKPFLLRLDPETFAALQRWAGGRPAER